MNNEGITKEALINEVLKVYVDSFLERKELMDSTTELKKFGLENEKGKLYTNQVLALQVMLQEDLKIFGLDIVEVLKQNGIEFKAGELSSLEHQYINNIVNNLLGFLDKLEQIKQKKGL